MTDEASRSPALDPEALSRLAGGLAHELKNPLSTLSLHLALLREDWSEEKEPRARRLVRTLTTLEEEVGRLNEILEDFLRFARTDQIECSPASLNQIVDRVVQFVTPEAESRGIRIRTFFDVNLPEVNVDAGQLRQAILNLLVNARQALEEKGGQITVITRREDDNLALEVVDDGPGMAADVLERCQQVYFSTKRGGSGLGMATVRRILEAHGGHMEIESSPGHGTRVVLSLPLGGRQ